MILKRFESIEDAATGLADQVAGTLRDAVESRGRASLLVPGGRTPVPLFRALRSRALPWQQIGIGLTDERWVASDHPDSNARLVSAELLADAASAARFLPLHNAAATAAQGAARSWLSVADLIPFDVVVLGMGEDGHFASLFPRSPGIEAALDVTTTPGCVAMRAPSAPMDRISLNMAALGGARRMFLFITGHSKLALIQAAGKRAMLPIDALLAVRDPEPVVYWAP
jgi:6-phosphogluconolactonase